MVAAVRAHINRRLVDEIDDDTSEEPDVTEDQNVDATEKALDTTYNVNNLVDQELQLEEECEDHDDTQDKFEENDVSDLPNDDQETNDEQEGNRSRRSSRQEIDYKFLHTFGHRK